MEKVSLSYIDTLIRDSGYSFHQYLMNDMYRELLKKKESLILNRINDLAMLNIYFSAIVNKETERLLKVEFNSFEHYFLIEDQTPVFLIAIKSQFNSTNQIGNWNPNTINHSYYFQSDNAPSHIVTKLKELLNKGNGNKNN